MKIRVASIRWVRLWIALLVCAGVAITYAPRLHAQEGQIGSDAPMVYEPMQTPPPKEAGPAMKVLQAVCWYLPNRLMDLTDVFRFHLAVGDGMGATVRATKFLCASWFEDNARCVGWTKRKPPIFGEHIEERYFGFLFAQEGEIDRDPTEVGLSAHLMVIGLNFALSASEALDAVLGVAGIDLMGDDHGPSLFDFTDKK
jgi:hypothetical protein